MKKKQKPRGGPTPEITQRLTDALRAGNYRRTAAQYAGINHGTFYAWLAKAEAGDARFQPFVDAVKSAESEAVVNSVALIRTAAKTQWQAAAWFLERKYPDEWGRRERVELTGADGAAIKTEGELTLKIPKVDTAAVIAILRGAGVADRVSMPPIPENGNGTH